MAAPVGEPATFTDFLTNARRAAWHEVTSPGFTELVDVDADVLVVSTGHIFTEGPIWHPKDECLYFSDIPGNKRLRWSADSGTAVVAEPSHKANGMTADPSGRLIVCEHASSSVTRIAPGSGEREVLCSHFEGKELNSPNDVVMRSDGTVYFTDPTYGRLAPTVGVVRPLEQGFCGVFRLAPDHAAGTEPLLAWPDREYFRKPNGLCLSPDERLLYVDDTEQSNISVFDVAPDGTLTNVRIFAEGITEVRMAPNGKVDGIKCDERGNVYVTAPYGVWVYSPDGTKLGEIRTPQPAANLHWGGPDWRTLFITANTAVYAVQLKVAGRKEPFMHRA